MMSQQEVPTLDNNVQVLFQTTVVIESTQDASIFLQAKFNGKINYFVYFCNIRTVDCRYLYRITLLVTNVLGAIFILRKGVFGLLQTTHPPL